MKIYVWRHGKAEDRSITGRDADRRLVPTGEAVTRKIAQALLSRGEIIQKIYTSPYIRAHETARVIQNVMRCPGEMEVMPELASGANPWDIHKALRSRKDLPETFALVGHMPDLSAYLKDLLGESHAESLWLNTSAVAKVTADHLQSGGAAFGWMISPSDLND